jgi:hypothetical protein
LVNQTYEDFIKNQKELNSCNSKIIKNMARLHFLKHIQPKFESLIKEFEKTSSRRYTYYLTPGAPRPMGAMGIGREIVEFVREVLKERIDIFAIDDPQKYDIHRPFPEDEQITDQQRKFDYRKAKWENISAMDKLAKLKEKIEREISTIEKEIDSYGNKVDQPLK